MSALPEGLVAHYFRHESGRLVAALARRFRVVHLEDAEDAVQEALMVALTAWSLKGIPDEPSAWLYRVASNTLADRVRRNGALARALVRGAADPGSDVEPAATALSTELPDDQLRMLFVCCDPSLPAESQLVLALKVLCGFRVDEIALRLFTSEANVYKRLSRARDALAARGIDLDTPPDVPARLVTVQAVLYLLFNEGYSASRGDALLRGELCEEALRLGYLLLAHEACDVPSSRALVALFHLHTARFATRVDATGEILTMAEQDRGRWDQAHVLRGLHLLTTCTDAATTSRYHVEAAIAAEHVLAPSFAATRFDEIAELYGLLDRIAPSPLNALNRAVALAEAHGPEAGLAALSDVRLPPGLSGYYLWDAVVGDLFRRAGQLEQARGYLERAAENAPSHAERALLQRRLATCR